MTSRQSNSSHAEPVERLIDEFCKLPGIGRRSAERMAFHVLKADADEVAAPGKAIEDVKSKVRHCRICFNLTDERPLPHLRGAVTRCVGGHGGRAGQGPDQPRADCLYRGVYHVLMGQSRPAGRRGGEHLTITDLLARIDDPSRNCREVAVAEVILGLNPDLEGDSTALYLERRAQGAAACA